MYIIPKSVEKERLRQSLLRAADEAYKSEVVDTLMEPLIVGKGLEYYDKDDWIERKLEEWLYPEERELDWSDVEEYI